MYQGFSKCSKKCHTMSPLTDLQVETKGPTDISTSKMFCMKSELPEEEWFINQAASIKLNQVNVMGIIIIVGLGNAHQHYESPSYKVKETYDHLI